MLFIESDWWSACCFGYSRNIANIERKLFGKEFDNLGQLAQWVAALNSQFQKNAAIVEAYNPYLVDVDGEDDEEEEIAAAKWNWGKKIVMVPNP